MPVTEASAPASPEDAPGYSFRPSLMAQPHVFRLGPQALYYEAGGFGGSISYPAIRRLRLSFRPASLASYRFTAEIWSDNNPKLTIASTSWRSVMEQQRQDAPYSRFVRELVRRIGAAGGEASLETGSAPTSFWPGLAICAAMMVALPWIVFRGIQAGAYGGAALVAGILVLFGWQVGMLFWRNRPGAFRADDIPSRVLPAG